MVNSTNLKDCFLPFKSDISGINLPSSFTFPFYYDVHPLAKIAAEEIQIHIENQTEWNHNFGLNNENLKDAIGKMFGVLVVQNKIGELGYLAAFSGKLAEKNIHSKFVPPIYDMLQKEGFFRTEEAKIVAINTKIERLKEDSSFKELQKIIEIEIANKDNKLHIEKEKLKKNKLERKERLSLIKDDSSELEIENLQEKIKQESINDKFYIHEYKIYLEEKLAIITTKKDLFQEEIDSLTALRKQRSAALQESLFNKYHFLNIEKKTKGVFDIFTNPNTPPPAGSGDCAAPKLLQFAFSNNLKPIALAEFWWGEADTSVIRKHKHFYPSCRSKCEPILGHMLSGMLLDKNPLLENPAEGKSLEIIFEDEHMLAVNKPTEFLSVPGKIIKDSVYTRIQKLYPDATGPIIVHRLDMSTSGILLLAKTKKVHKFLQKQFIDKTIEKRYVAKISRLLKGQSGVINLPLRVDLDNRPRQMVCYEHGKNAITKWERIEEDETSTKIFFYPITGRTHQLRMHAAHPKGLNAAIVGDDLYGIKQDRLYLHAQSIRFIHPATKKEVLIETEAPF